MMINNLCFHVPCNPAFYEAKESYDEVCLEATIYFEIIDLEKIENLTETSLLVISSHNLLHGYFYSSQ